MPFNLDLNDEGIMAFAMMARAVCNKCKFLPLVLRTTGKSCSNEEDEYGCSLALKIHSLTFNRGIGSEFHQQRRALLLRATLSPIRVSTWQPADRQSPIVGPSGRS